MKKLSIILSFIICCFMAVSVHAENQDNVSTTNESDSSASFLPDYIANETGIYDLRYYETDVYDNYKHAIDNIWKGYLNDYDNIKYYQLVDKMEGLEWAIDGASYILDQGLSKQRYLEILSGMLTAMSYDLSKYIDVQKDLDSLKSLSDYTQDVASIMVQLIGIDASATSTASANIKKQFDDLAYSMGVTWAGIEFVLKQQESFELYERILQNYSMYNDFLLAIEKYTDDKDLKEAASVLRKSVSTLLNYQLEIVANASGDVSKFLGKDIIFEGIIPDMLKNKDVLNISQTDYEVLSGLNSTLQSLNGLKTLGEATFKLCIFGGDMLFGTSNVFNRYNEVFAIRKIRDALNKAIETEAVTIQGEEDINKIKKVQNLMINLLFMDYRGEYCIYNMLVNDSQLLSLFQLDKYEDYRNWLQQVENITASHFEILENIFPSIENYPMINEPIADIESNPNTDGVSLSAYQGIFMKDDTFISLPLYTSIEESGAIGIAYITSCPTLDENGYIIANTLDTLGEIYALDSNNNYEIRNEQTAYALSYHDGKIILSGDSLYDGAYLQISNSGANMSASDIWLNIPNQLVDSASNTSSTTDNTTYDTIIQKYIDGLNLQLDFQGLTERNLCYLIGYDLSMENNGYCLMDIDNNGVDELLIGPIGKDNYPGFFYDLYTMSNNNAILSARSAERSRFSLRSNGIIGNEGSGGAMLSTWAYYTLKEAELMLEEAIMYDGDYDNDNPWFYCTTDSFDDHSHPISESDASAIKESYITENISYTPFSAYNGDWSTNSKEISPVANTGDGEGQSEYIFPNSNSIELTEEQLQGLTAEQLGLARNEIYARHGRQFNSANIQEYFNSKSWYVPQYTPEEFDVIENDIFNDMEKKNRDLIVKVEQNLG